MRPTVTPGAGRREALRLFGRRGVVRCFGYDRLDGVRRGDVVTVALQGDQGKPRPALILQTDLFGDLPAVTVLPITSTLLEAPLIRVQIQPSEQNGLAKRSQIMVDKAQTPTRSKLGQVIGRLEGSTMLQVNQALALFLGLA